MELVREVASNCPAPRADITLACDPGSPQCEQRTVSLSVQPRSRSAQRASDRSSGSLPPSDSTSCLWLPQSGASRCPSIFHKILPALARSAPWSREAVAYRRRAEGQGEGGRASHQAGHFLEALGGF